MPMYVCVCNAVTDRSINAAIKRGASSVADLMVACDAGTCCGACHPELERMLAAAAHAPRRPGIAQRLLRS